MCTVYKERPSNTLVVQPRGYVQKHGVHPSGHNHAKLGGLILDGLRALGIYTTDVIPHQDLTLDLLNERFNNLCSS